MRRSRSDIFHCLLKDRWTSLELSLLVRADRLTPTCRLHSVKWSLQDLRKEMKLIYADPSQEVEAPPVPSSAPTGKPLMCKATKKTEGSLIPREV